MKIRPPNPTALRAGPNGLTLAGLGALGFGLGFDLGGDPSTALTCFAAAIAPFALAHRAKARRTLNVSKIRR